MTLYAGKLSDYKWLYKWIINSIKFDWIKVLNVLQRGNYKIDHISKIKNCTEKKIMKLKIIVRSIRIFPVNLATFEFCLYLLWPLWRPITQKLKIGKIWNMNFSFVWAHCASFTQRWTLLTGGWGDGGASEMLLTASEQPVSDYS